MLEKDIINFEVTKKLRDEATDNLIHIIKKDNIELLRLLIKVGANVNYNNNEALIYAVENGKTKVVELLIQAGANAEDKDGLALKISMEKGYNEISKILLNTKNGFNNVFVDIINNQASEGNIETIRMLIESTISNSKDDDYIKICNKYLQEIEDIIHKGLHKEYRNNWIFALAIKNNYIDLVKMFISKGVNINFSDPFHQYRSRRPSSYSPMLDVSATDWPAYNKKSYEDFYAQLSYYPLKIAVQNGYTEMVKEIIKLPIDKEYITRYILIAAEEGYKEIIELLIQKGGEWNYYNRNYRNPILMAAKNNHMDIVKLLLEKGNDVNNTNGALIVWASKYNDLELVKELIKRNIDVNYFLRERSDCIALIEAIQNQNIDIVKELINAGVDVNKGDAYWSPLEKAIRCENMDIIKALVEAGSDYSKGAYLSAKEKDIDIFKYFIDLGAETKEIFEYCLNNIEFLKYAIKKCGITDKNSYKAVNIASSTGDVEFLEELLKSGANVQNTEAMKKAIKGEHLEIIKIFEKYNFDFFLFSLYEEIPVCYNEDILIFLYEKCIYHGRIKDLIWVINHEYLDLAKMMIERKAVPFEKKELERVYQAIYCLNYENKENKKKCEQLMNKIIKLLDEAC